MTIAGANEEMQAKIAQPPKDVNLSMVQLK